MWKGLLAWKPLETNKRDVGQSPQHDIAIEKRKVKVRVSADLTIEDGAFLVQLARKAIEQYLETGEKISPPDNAPSKLRERMGVFVTLNETMRNRRELRGCIGYPYPELPLCDATVDSAVSAAVNDPRFPPVQKRELGDICLEVSVLSPPVVMEALNPLDYPKKIEIGRDGLIVERGWNRGLLLPQVPVEFGWDEEEFLSQCCHKAGLTMDAWLLRGTRIYRFQALIFEEEAPGGHICRKHLSGSE